MGLNSPPSLVKPTFLTTYYMFFIIFCLWDELELDIMLSGLICIECRIEEENQGIFANTNVKNQMGQGRRIVGRKSSSVTYTPFEYSSIHHTSLECKQPSHEDYKAVEQMRDKELVYLEFKNRASLILRNSSGT